MEGTEAKSLRIQGSLSEAEKLSLQRFGFLFLGDSIMPQGQAGMQ